MTTKHVPHDQSRDSDSGAVLIMALAMIVIGALIVLPLLDYAMTVSRAGRVQMNTTANDEIVKAGIHVALADPISLYTVCANAGLQTEQPLATPPGFAVQTGCSWVDAQASENPESLWYSAATTQAGSTLPTGVAEANATYGSSGAADPQTWWAAASSVQSGDTIWNPDLPAFDDRFQTKYTMPTAGYGDCTVYFPGKYTDPLTISGPGKTFFANGIYYFANTVKFTGNADVVIGDGLTEGCTDTPDAVLYGENASGDGISLPAVNGGVGATFVFGGAGRMVIDNSVPTSAGKTLSVIFNKRYVQGTEVSTASSAGVSIMTVNGLLVGTDTIGELHTPTIAVKIPNQTGTTPSPAPGSRFKPSTLVPPDLVTPTPAIVDINMTATSKATVHIPGYVAAPQGIIKVNYAPGMTGGKDVMINGGVLGAQIVISPDRPDTDADPASSFVIGLENPTVQQTFKITSRTTGPPPLVTATAIVQVNQSGVAWVNSYVVQSN
jgi:hypothetical protein